MEDHALSSLRGLKNDEIPGTGRVDIAPVDKETDLERRRRHARELDQEFHFVLGISGELYYYQAGRYLPGGEELISHVCERRWPEDTKPITTADIHDIIAITRRRSWRGPDDPFCLEPGKVILQNRVWDVESGEMYPHDPEYMSLSKLGVFYNPEATCPVFDKYFDACFPPEHPDSTRNKQILLEMLAMCILPISFQKMHILHGSGGNGKGLFLRILRAFLGGVANVSGVSLRELEEGRNAHATYGLYGQLANVSGDNSEEDIKHVGTIRTLTGGDVVTVNPKNRDTFSWEPTLQLIFVFNRLPRIDDHSDGLARRIQVVEWPVSFVGREKIEYEDIATDPRELSGILNKIIPIAQKLIQKRRPIYATDSPQETQRKWMLRSDSFFGFCDECLVFGSQEEIATLDLYKAYADYCMDMSYDPLSITMFGRRMAERTGQNTRPRKREGKSVRIWYGVGLKALPQGNQSRL